MSRKPRTFAILLLMAAFLMANVAVAGAWTINMGNTSGGYYTYQNVVGTIYKDATGDSTYARVYASINGIALQNYVGNNLTNESTFNIPLTTAFAGLNSVELFVYDWNGVSDYVYEKAYAPFYVNVYNVGGGGGGGAPTTTTTPTTPPATTAAPPAVTATIGGAAVSVSAAKGATVSATGIAVTIPAGALPADVKVTIAKVANTAGLKLAAGSNIIGDVLEILKDKTGNFSKPVTVSLDFDKTKVDMTKFDVKVCFYDETAQKWVALDNIKVDANGKVSGEVTHFTKFAVIASPKAAATTTPAGLKDVAGHWAEANISKLVASGAIAGYPDGTFKPNATITRAEFATILVKAFKLAPSSSKVFADTASHWAKADISAAAAAGIVNGYSATQFGPNDQITREQMAVMIAKAAKLATAKNGKVFADKAQISAWAAAAIASASESGIIGGYPDNTFKAKATATRAEAVTVIVKALK